MFHFTSQVCHNWRDMILASGELFGSGLLGETGILSWDKRTPLEEWWTCTHQKWFITDLWIPRSNRRPAFCHLLSGVEDDGKLALDSSCNYSFSNASLVVAACPLEISFLSRCLFHYHKDYHLLLLWHVVLPSVAFVRLCVPLTCLAAQLSFHQWSQSKSLIFCILKTHESLSCSI